MSDRFAAAGAVADTVLHEGYVLYPYRASAAKNRLRWQFGVLVPPAFAAADPSERCGLRCECLCVPAPGTRLAVRARFLRVERRAVEAAGPAGTWEPVASLSVAGNDHVSWDEAAAEDVDLEVGVLDPAGGARREREFSLAGGEVVEVLRDGAGTVAGRVVRRRAGVGGRLTVATVADGPWLRVTVGLANTTVADPPPGGRDDALPASLVAAHLVLAVDGGRWLSVTDPPGAARAATAACRSEGCHPVLVGDDDTVVLAAPIILPDHPEVAPESPGDLCDATEIDEILALRVLTLTDEEKAEARATDRRAAAIVDRCDGLPPEVWSRLHGAVRSLGPAAGGAGTAPPWWDPGVDAAVDPWSDAVVVGGAELRAGTAVRLRPSRRADAHDLFLAGMTARVAGVFRDVDGGEHVAVSLDDDPATAELAWQGRYLYFEPDELEPLP